MDSNTGKYGAHRRLHLAIGIALIIGLAGCARAVHVGEQCEGLDSIGYSLPVSQTDLDDIKALGFTECAEYIEQNGLLQ